MANKTKWLGDIPIADWKMDKETKQFLLDHSFTVWHSGGGCIHLLYKGWILNSYYGEGHDDMYALDKIKMSDLLQWGQVWNDDGGNETYFINTLKEGKEFVDQYNIDGDKFDSDKVYEWHDLLDIQGGEMDLDDHNYYLCQWENSWLVVNEQDLIKKFPHDIHEKDLGWSGWNRFTGKTVAIDTFWDTIMYMKDKAPFEMLFMCDNMQIQLMRSKHE